MYALSQAQQKQTAIAATSKICHTTCHLPNAYSNLKLRTRLNRFKTGPPKRCVLPAPACALHKIGSYN